VQWLTPPPLWQELSAAADPTAYRRPAILRFATDTFMQDLQSVLKFSPQTLRDYVAQGENWRNPAAGLDPAGTALPLKLYQPNQARFYLIASSLTCRMPGLPDHTVNKSAGESVVFVVRQLRPNPGFTAADCAVYDPAKCTEYAWIPTTSGVPPVAVPPPSLGAAVSTSAASGASAAAPQGVSGTQQGWTQVSAPGALVAGEEQIPLSLTQTGSNGSSRRIFLGLIPASRRQQYIAGRTLAGNGSPNSSSGNDSGSSSGSSNGCGSATSTPTDPRMDMFFRQIIGPWCNLQDWWTNIPSPSPSSSQYGEYEGSSQLSSALILYDFSTFLSQYLPNVWGAVGDSSKVAGLNSAEAALYNKLGSQLQQALLQANQFGPQFEAVGIGTTFPPSGYTPYALTDVPNFIKPTTLQAPVSNALPPLGTVAPPPAVPPLAQQPANPQGDCYFIVRCVYVRPQCHSAVLSPPSQPFLLASYFDSDAPARRIQVALPVDTSPAALRKYDKGVAFLISDELRNQMARVASLDDLAKGNIGSPGVGLGFICSFSIPIITICAMILLFVIVIALNLVFFWMPFFKICFPVPTLKGK